MKHLKAKLMGAVVMLLISALMLTTASYAWFTISTAPEVTDITANVATNGNLEIALDATVATSGTAITYSVPSGSAISDSGKNTTWGNVVDLGGAFKSSGSNKFTLKPVEPTKSGDAITGFKYPQFGLDGRINQLNDLACVSVADGTDTAFNDYAGVRTFIDNTSGDSNVWALEFDYWLRSNQDGEVTLNKEGTDRGTGETGYGSWVSDKNMSIKFAAYTYSTSTGISATPDAVFDAVADESAITTTTSGGVGKYGLTLDNVSTATGAKDSITLTANTPVLVKMFVYWDGSLSTMTNASFASTVEELGLNVQFQHSASLTAMSLTGSGNSAHPSEPQ